MKALVIGGTGPTGPFLVNGLIAQGYQVSILHRGTHDSDQIPRVVERIIGDPHFRESLTEALGERTFDLIIATYGRIRYVAEVVAGRTGRLITIGGSPSYRGLLQPGDVFPRGAQVPLPESAPRVASEAEFRFGYLVRITEDAVMQGHADGHYQATHFRYPVVYGPRQLTPTIWAVMRRVMDGRDAIVLPEGGLSIVTRGYSENVAHAVLLAARQPDIAGGQIYNCGDETQLTLAQWVQVAAEAMGGKLDIVSVPDRYAYSARTLLMFNGPADHQLFDLHKIKSELGYRDRVPVLEAMRRTVQWYRDNPPDEGMEFIADLAQHYRTEDALIAIQHEAAEKMATVEHVARDFHHPYPHPKQPGMGRDHRAR